MDLNELKTAWCKVSAEHENRATLAIEKIDQLLQKRGNGILSRLDRNVKFGFWLLGLFLLLTLLDQYFPAERLLPNAIEQQIVVPVWISVLGVSVNIVLMLSFILFVIRYRRLKVKNLAAQDMPTALRKVLRLLNTFKREFYLALGVFFSAIVTSFLYGAWTGFTMASGGSASTTLKAEILIVVFLVLMIALFIGVLFYVFHKGFNSLYGKYREQLIQALNELEEQED